MSPQRTRPTPPSVDTFDSRALRQTDCFGQRFMRPGTYRYDTVPAGWADVSVDRPYTVTVLREGEGDVPRRSEHDQEMDQVTISVAADGKHYRPEEPDVTVRQGDLVLWHCPHPSPGGFAVVGDKAFFGSRSLVNECGYSHAFAAAGDHRWVDANGSGLEGLVRVRDPKAGTNDDFARWQQELAVGTLVLIADGKAEPAEVTVTTGQTVFFAVVTSEGITVTDARLVARPDEPGPVLELPKPPTTRPRSTPKPKRPVAATGRTTAKKATAKKTTARRAPARR